MRINGLSDPKYTPDVCHSLKISLRSEFEYTKYDDFVTSKQLFVKTFCFQGTQRPETYTVEFVETKQITVVQCLFFAGQFYTWSFLQASVSMVVTVNRRTLNY